MSLQPPNDSKDWTIVLSEVCGQCGIDVRSLTPAQITTLIRDTVEKYTTALKRPGATVRPAPRVWSVHEYCAHVGQMYAVMTQRLILMLEQEDPSFANWDQDAAALAGHYATLSTQQVETQLIGAANDLRTVLESLRPEQYSRRGYRSNGSVFTVSTLAQYAWHDAAHHLHYDLGVKL